MAITTDAKGVARIWPLPRDDRSLATLRDLAMLLAGRRIDPSAGAIAIPAAELQALWESLRQQDLPELLPSEVTESEWEQLIHEPG